MDNCKFDRAWVGKCKVECDGDFCDEHKDKVCCSCGEQATRECSETMGLVCGFPLCDNCEHTIRDNGCNSGGELPEGLKGHCKKDEQLNKPWYMKDEEPKENKEMTVLDLLVGRKMTIMTDLKVEVELEIKSVEQNSHTRQITPDTQENDWWGESETTHSYMVTFTNGAKKKFGSINQIKVKYGL